MATERNDKSSAKKTDKPAKKSSSTIEGEEAVGATIVLGNVHGDFGNRKHDLDLAFAKALLRSGLMNERQLAKAVDDWTIHGSSTLSEHLQKNGLIQAADANRLLTEADRKLDQANTSLTNDGRNTTDSQIARDRLSIIDPTGRILRMIGLNDGASLQNTHSSRQAGSEFTLIRKLGEGGLGTVWLARDEHLRRLVAIKEIRKREGDPGDAAIARFRREAEITGRLEHPGIVPIYQMGIDTQTGKTFYVMRFLGKRSMQDSIAEYHERREAGTDEPVLLHRLLTGFANLCKSVAHAHSKKVIHRDLKPENVALDNFGQVVLLDWGLARLNDESADLGAGISGDVAENLEMTLAGEVLGSPMYMAPEQAAGRQDDIDERTDIYGLGGILFSILTGEAPHERAQESIREKTGANALLTSIVANDVKRARELVPSIPPALDAICTKAMAKKRYLRYQTARTLAEDMDRYMAGGKVSAYQATARERVKQWMSVHPRESAILAAVLTVCGIVFGMSLFTRKQTDAARQQARFSSANDLINELKISLQSDAKALARDVRFIGDLPPVAAINASVENPNNGEGDEVDPWKERLSSIFTGLLRGRESYLTIAYSMHQDQQMSEIVRSDRSRAGNQVRAVPASRLKVFETNTKSIEEWMAMKPGDVILRSTSQLTEDVPTDHKNALTIVAGTPLYSDETGDYIGVTVVEMDLKYLFLEQLNAIGRESTEVLITDEKGVIQLRYLNGSLSSKLVGSNVQEVLSEVEPLFAEDSDLKKYSNGTTIVAQRILLGSQITDSEVELGVIVRISNEE